MEQIINDQTMNNNPENGAKTFTQEQLNAIIGERLAKEKAKSDAALVEREQQLAIRELRMTAKEKLAELGLPVSLMDALNVSSQEALDKSLEIVSRAFQNHKEPQKVIERRLPTGDPTPPDTTEKDLRKAMRLP